MTDLLFKIGKIDLGVYQSSFNNIDDILCVLILIAHLPKIHQNNRKYNNNYTIPPPRLEGKDDF